MKHGGQVSNLLDVSSLAKVWRDLLSNRFSPICSKVTDGYTPGHMTTACESVLTERRVNQLQKKPLQSLEFVAPLARIEPIYKEEEEAFKVCDVTNTLG